MYIHTCTYMYMYVVYTLYVSIVIQCVCVFLIGDFTVPVVMDNLREVMMKRGGTYQVVLC